MLGVEGGPPSCKGPQLLLHPAPGACGLHEELAGGGLQHQGHQPHHGARQQPQGQLREAEDLCHGYVRPPTASTATFTLKFTVNNAIQAIGCLPD